MSYASQVFGGSRATKKIKNSYSVAGFSPQIVSGQIGAIVVNSGAMTANALKTIFSSSGAPIEMSLLTIRTADGAARTMRVVVEIDGNTADPAFDYTSFNFGLNGYGVCLAGNQIVSTINFSQSAIRADSSLVIKVASNLSETDKFIIEYAYQELM